jgi:hypothetical protein
MNIQFLHHNNKGKNQEHVVKFIYGHFIYHPCNCQKQMKKSILQKRKVLQFGKLTLRENKGFNFPLVSFVGWRLWKTTFATSVLGTLDVVTFLVLTTFGNYEGTLFDKTIYMCVCKLVPFVNNTYWEKEIGIWSPQ